MAHQPLSIDVNHLVLLLFGGVTNFKYTVVVETILFTVFFNTRVMSMHKL